MTESSPGPDRLLTREDSVLLLIDFQERLLKAMADKDRVLENAVRLARFANLARLPVLVTEQDNLGDTVPELAAELERAEKFGKIYFDCLAEEDFRARLGLLGRRTLIIAGLEAHICVAQTGISALEDRYLVHVVGDAVASRHPDNRRTALDRLRQAGAVITSTEMAIYEILRRAGTEEFKETLPLVK
ncbi:MAG: hydrolase [Thermodesulfobacteriota bacterium]